MIFRYFFKNLTSVILSFAELHGVSGPIHVEPLRHAPGLKPFLDSVQEVGYNVFDLSSFQDGEGFMATEMTTDKGRRGDTYRRFLRPLWGRKNLKISRFSHVIKVFLASLAARSQILMNTSLKKFICQIHLDRQKSAYGVSYVRHGITKFVRADKEIILSAGAINSPQLLLLSGIGPRSHLNATGIKCRLNLPVGENLQDHPLTFVGPILVNESHSLMPDRDFTVSAVTDYLLNGTGAV